MFKIHYWNTTEPCFLESMAKPCLTRKCIVCGVISYANFQIMELNKTNPSRQGKLLLAELRRDFLEVECKGYIWQENVGKKAKPCIWVEIVTYLTHGILKSVSLNDAGGGWNSSRKRTMTYIVVKSGQHHKKWKVKWRKVCNILKLSLRISRVL